MIWSCVYLCGPFWLYLGSVMGSRDHPGNAVGLDRGSGPCGEELTAEKGSFRSPIDPETDEYPPNTTCTWTITAKPGKIILLTFFRFRITDVNDWYCSKDFVQVYDIGNGGNNVSLGRFCQLEEPAPIMSRSNAIVVTFGSDDASNEAGFIAEYQTTPAAQLTCGGHFSDSNGSFGSRRDDITQNYPPNSTCVWSIKGGPDENVILEFIHFQLERYAGFDCARESDYLLVQDTGKAGNATELGRFCGTRLPDRVISYSNEVSVTFVSYGTVQNTGFVAKYQKAMISCGGQFNSPTGFFGSPKNPYTGHYPPNSTCHWTIKGQPGQVVTVKFIAYETESYPQCILDYVLVKDAKLDTPLGRRFCAHYLPPSLTTISNEMHITFVSDHKYEQSGFTAEYYTQPKTNVSRICGGELTAPTGQFASPVDPKTGKYPRETTCVWLITAKPGEIITLHFSSFELGGPSPNCPYDYVVVKDTSSNQQLARFCTDGIPPPVISVSHEIVISFTSDHSGQMKGFTAHYQTARAFKVTREVDKEENISKQ